MDSVVSPAAVPAVSFPPNDALGRDNNFNFLRLLFASLVILSHSPELVDGDRRREILSRIFHTVSFGEVAVDGFFLLSGFLILQSWQRQPRLTLFLKKRILRIVPGFLAAYLVSGLIVGPLAANPADYFRNLKPLSFAVALLSLKGPVVPDVFAGLHPADVNGSLWTISHEIRCYLLVPLLAWLGFARNRLAWLAVSVVLLLNSIFGPPFPYASMTGTVWRHLLPDVPEETFRLAAFFCVGGCFYLFRSEVRYGRAWANAAAVILTLCLFQATLAQIALASVGAYLLFWFAFARFPQLDFFKGHADISYGVYLYAWPVQSLLIWNCPHWSPWDVCAVTAVICTGLGLVSWHLVELPFLRLKPRHDPRDVPHPSAV